MSKQHYPIAETFYSLQGEGLYAGTPMFFIRLAGCNVGKYCYEHPDGELQGLVTPTQANPVSLAVQTEHSICTSSLGQTFVCDTDYHTKEKLTAGEIAAHISSVGHICITGGEPLMHDLVPLLVALAKHKIIKAPHWIHIETSGTLPIIDLFHALPNGTISADELWITCSPKEGFMEQNVECIDEYKFVINFDTLDDTSNVVKRILHTTRGVGHKPIYIQPANPIDSLNTDALRKAIEFVQTHSFLRLSQQHHKSWNLR